MPEKNITLSQQEMNTSNQLISKYIQAEVPGDRYAQVLKKTDGDTEVEVHEYLTHEGSSGYQIFLYRTKENVVFEKSQGYGVEARSRTYDWREVIN